MLDKIIIFNMTLSFNIKEVGLKLTTKSVVINLKFKVEAFNNAYDFILFLLFFFLEK
jgi:hypothetical protein